MPSPAALTLNQWALAGEWDVDPEKAVLRTAPGKIAFQFYARDLHLVVGPAPTAGRCVSACRLDGAPPAADHGSDTDEKGRGVIKEQRLYQFIRQSSEVREHLFSIEFLDPGAQAFSFYIWMRANAFQD